MLLTYMLPAKDTQNAHPPVAGLKPAANTVDAPAYRNTLKWIQTDLKQNVTDYSKDVNFTLPGTPTATSQPATAPASRK
ncbi:MAG: hypothetical protein QM770_16775 [Tepidisphaeraceae bacterium]